MVATPEERPNNTSIGAVITCSMVSPAEYKSDSTILPLASLISTQQSLSNTMTNCAWFGSSTTASVTSLGACSVTASATGSTTGSTTTTCASSLSIIDSASGTIASTSLSFVESRSKSRLTSSVSKPSTKVSLGSSCAAPLDSCGNIWLPFWLCHQTIDAATKPTTKTIEINLTQVSPGLLCWTPLRIADMGLALLLGTP